MFPMELSDIGREVYWNIPWHSLIYLLVLIPIAIFLYGVYRRIALWRIGTETGSLDNIGGRLWIVIRDGIFHKRIIREPFPGLIHAALFFGFLALFLAAGIDASHHYLKELGLEFLLPLKGGFYLLFSFVIDILGLVGLIGIIIAAYRRYVMKPPELDNKPEDAIVLGLLFLIFLTGFILEAFRLGAEGFQGYEYFASPIGMIFAAIIGRGSEATNLGLHRFFWWFHMIIAFAFIAYIPYSRLWHIFSGLINMFFQTQKPKGWLARIEDMENCEMFGCNELEHFTWKQLMESDACTRCGRCQENCPAYLTDKPLNPKKMTQDFKDNMNAAALKMLPQVFAKSAESAGAPAEGGEAEAAPANGNGGSKFFATLDKIFVPIYNAIEGKKEAEEPPTLLDGSIQRDEVWSCTTCRACMEACPVNVEHIPKTIEMRRYEVLMEGGGPKEIVAVFKGMENNSNPWNVGFSLRGDWAKDLGVKTLAEDADVDVLYYVGCAGAFDDRNKKVAIAIAKILQKAGVNFGILGTEEGCCGDSARRMGNEYLFEYMALQNVEIMNGYGVKKIITACPHGYNTLKNEYPDYGGNYEVYHATEFILQLIKNGQIKLTKPLNTTVTYHDSCFLGRYNDVYDQPREIIKSLPGVELKEMGRIRQKSFCCGAGGGRMWMEETLGTRINQARTKDALETGANTICTVCPFCLTMLSDGLKELEKEEAMESLDLMELILEAMED